MQDYTQKRKQQSPREYQMNETQIITMTEQQIMEIEQEIEEIINENIYCLDYRCERYKDFFPQKRFDRKELREEDVMPWM